MKDSLTKSVILSEATLAPHASAGENLRFRKLLCNPRFFVASLLRMTWSLTTLLLAAALTLFNARPAHSQNGIDVRNANVVVMFGQHITFQAQIAASLPILQASILFRELNEEITRVETLQVGPDNNVSFTYDASQNVLPPFSTIVFWYQVTLSDNQTYTSTPIQFRYDDNRFPWRESASSIVRVHWYEGDDAFGQSALDAAGSGLLKINEVMPLTLNAPIDIYIYSNVGDLQGALQLGGEEWVGGHANPELGVVMVAIAPGGNQSIEMQTEIPHELAHVMLWRSLGDGYDRQPVWLIEGLASMVELYPNPEYAKALNDASQKDALLHFVDLCDAFPPDAAGAFLAYAQSQSFVTYLYTNKGTTGLTSLVNAYADGLSCDLGAKRALSMSLPQLDTQWREVELGQNVVGVVLRNLAPFALLMFVILLVPLWGAVDIFRERSRRRGVKSE
ncbi:MAG: peptidase MA family metallohydrolase [Chloroflexota bacterium]